LWLGFNDGSRLLCKDIAPDRDGETSADLKESPKGVAASATRREPRSSERKIEFALLDQPCKTSLENLVFFQPLSGRAEYLSQIKPAEYRHVPYLGVAWPYALDRNVQGGGLRVGGQFHLKGIGLHSAARLSYDLPPGVKRFQAEAALDDSSVEGSVRFRVFVDGKEKYSSPTLRGGMPPLPLDVDVAGAKRLELVVDFADRADVQDRADWLDARLIR
jgi:hypothetical protein